MTRNLSWILVPSVVVWLSAAVGIATISASESLLDGKRFVGQYQEYHKNGMKDDEIKFQNGTIYSRAYDDEGFAGGAYTARREKKVIYFDAEMTHASGGNGRIKWSGVVRGESIDVDYRWIRKGWFTDTIKYFVFRGTLSR